MDTASMITSFVDDVYDKCLNNQLDFVAIANMAGKISKNINYTQILNMAQHEMVSGQQKYSLGTQYTGYLGYYYPSQLRVLRTDNMKRGRLVKSSKRSDQIYNYDKNWNLISIVFPDIYTTAYRLVFQNVEFYITYKDYIHRDNPEILNATFYKKDIDLHTICMLDVSWCCRMESISQIDIDVCYESATKYRTISAIEHPNGNFLMFEQKDYAVTCNDEMDVIEFRE